MKKDRFKELSGIFQRMSFENQLKLIEFMAADISLWDEEPRYKNHLKTANQLLNYISEKITGAKKDKEITETMALLDTLSVNQLIKLLDSFSAKVHKFDDENKQIAAEAKCSEEGHIFTEWQVHEYTKYISSVEAYGVDGLWRSDRPHDPTIPLPITEWYRTCERCGFKEVVEEEPLEAREERLAREKQARIRKLKKELRSLEGRES